MIKKITSRFTRRDLSDNFSAISSSTPAPASLPCGERRLLRRVTAGAANAADRAAASYLLGSDLDARDFFFELVLESAEFNQ